MGISIDELLPEEEKHDKIAEQVAFIRQSHGRRYPTSYAISWVLANQVVQRYYGKQGLDAQPMWRESFGWSQFNLMRHTTCQKPPNRDEESQRYITFDGIAVNWMTRTDSDRARFDFEEAIFSRKQDPTLTLIDALDLLDLAENDGYNHAGCLHVPHAYAYTKLFQVVTDLICRAPEMVAKRELMIDIDHYGDPYEEAIHPLRQAGLAPTGTTREWFELFHLATNIRLYINIFTGDFLHVSSTDQWRVMDYPGWNERNEDQLIMYFSEILGIPLALA